MIFLLSWHYSGFYHIVYFLHVNVFYVYCEILHFGSTFIPKSQFWQLPWVGLSCSAESDIFLLAYFCISFREISFSSTCYIFWTTLGLTYFKTLCIPHLWPFSKSKFNLKSDRVNLVAPASPIYSPIYLTNVRALQYKMGPERLTRLGNSNVVRLPVTYNCSRT